MRKLFRSLIAVGGLAGLVACGDDVTVGGPAFAISGAPVTAIQVGAKVQLSANEAATWASSAANVATVDATGLVTAVGAGTASITATSTANPGRTASVTITVTAPAVRNVVVSPSNAVLRPGETQGFVANVDADPGVARTVTWASSNTAVATVTAAGVVTAVTPGATTITATSTANTTVSGAASVTVRQPTPATISVQTITVTGNQQQTVNVNNVAGSIDVNMNVDPGEQVVQRVEVLIDGNVACTQNLSGAQSEEMRIAAAFENIEDVIVSCQINTAGFAAATGIANFPNGPHTLSVRAIIAGGNDIATPSTPLIFNNLSGVIATFTNTNGSNPTSAIDTRTGLQWIDGDVTWKFVGVSYVPGTTVASVSCTLYEKQSRTFTLTSGANTTVYDQDPWANNDLDLGGYLTSPANATAGETIVCPSAVLSNGSPMTPTNGSVLLNYGSPANPTSGGNAAMPVLQVYRYDDVAPGDDSANGVVQPNVTLNAITNPWLASGTSVLPTNSNASRIGIQSITNLNLSELGVDALTIEVFATAAGVALPANTSALPCNTTGLTAITTGSQLAETTNSSAYALRISFKDALGNRICLDSPTNIGADFTAPTGTLDATSPVANTGYSTSPPNFSVTASDNASGFSVTAPLRVNMTRLNADGTTSCVIATGASSCTGGTTAAQPLSFDATGGADVVGYYTTSITLSDQAGNLTTILTNQLNGFDNVAPTFSGGISLPALIAGAATNTFNTSVADNLDLGSVFGVVAYPTGGGLNIQYQTQAIGTFGSPLEQSASVGYNASNWIRCLNVAGSFAVATNQPTTITLSLTDQTSVPVANTTVLASGTFGANAQACTGTGTQGAVGNTTINSFTDSLPIYHPTDALITSVDRDGVSVGATSSTSVVLTAKADVPLNTAGDPFNRVDFYYLNASGNLVRIGTATSTLAQTQSNRIFTYKLTWDPGAEVQTGNVFVVAIGVDAQGDGVLSSAGYTISIVP